MSDPQPPFIPLTSWRELPADAMQAEARAFYEDIARRRTVREYSDRPIPPGVLEDCLRAGGTAPSGANLQPWHFVVVQDPETKRKIRQAAEEEERAAIAEAVRLHTEVTGTRPRGWYTGRCSANTVRLVAETETDTMTVRLITEGPLSSPELTLSSSPALPDDEILAQLLFGKDLSQMSALQAAQMADAVATLTGGGSGLVGSIRDSFGLDDLDLQTSEEGSSALKLGKYISDSLYTDVTIDNAGKSVINLNYDATRNVTVKGSVSSEGDTGLGVFFERDY